MNPVITILQAFNEPLPLVEDDFKESYRKISTSVQSTMDTDPPSVFLQFEASELAVFSKEVLGRQFHPRSRVYADMPILEKNHVLKSEGDVVRIVTMQLLHPVNVVFEEAFPEANLTVHSEWYGGPKSRCDIIWSVQTPGRSEPRVILVLEIKNTHVLRFSDFSPAAAREETLEELKLKAHTLGGGDMTLLQANGIVISKQAQKYREQSAYVVVFDWNAMFLYDFAKERINRGKNAVKGAWFDESKTRSGKQDLTFRHVLLGQLCRAYKRQQSLLLQ
ncbi:hypothetical protein BDV33DRAFT_210342 [Aspergillus novoparasiticus]|uniref:Uncharacterized protein n=1 Tax=Aspergillus novoparasiticus TaxID=986946 RepID=A0A5N6E878_9EURO|nr:hypothetical protein BDV33DRAFT_210342 [Aspergillus novoparasiticus]